MDKHLKIRLAFVLLGLVLIVSMYVNIKSIDKAKVFDQNVNSEIAEIIEAHKEIETYLEKVDSKYIDKYTVLLVAEKNRLILNKILNLNKYYANIKGDYADYSKVALIYQDFEEYINFNLLQRDYSVGQTGYNVEYIKLEQVDIQKINLVKNLNAFLLSILEDSRYLYNNQGEVSFDINNLGNLLNDIENQIEEYIKSEYNSDWKWTSNASILDSLKD